MCIHPTGRWLETLRKLTLYDGGIKTPFIVDWPKVIKHGGSRRQLVSMVDLAPTLLEWAGASAPADMQGQSFAAAVTHVESKTRDYIYAERNWHGRNAHERAIRSVEYLYKENQFPLHGECYKSPFKYTQAFKELARAHQRGELSAAEATCFAKQRAAVELLRVDAQGRAVPGNLATDPAYTETLVNFAAALAEWRDQTEDFDYRPFDPNITATEEG